ncbi:class I SAM-dependent methyltransferase [Georgenia sp. TF02-10]|uniref:class I SAM-dependent methyltransferase n=1 Tax=Georgenia sp. TF02-10 TaxID=2917725 RepID=UPI001FA8098E|nr:class I SAM-dependent methyltransferase [Georgenia sp. TF02-10]UNX55995.1 class I SAM-dependent methyltransferase [Georgenia sp. TF02-10]
MWGRYAEKFRRLIREGVDLGTEARFIDMLLPRASTILDVGCGTGSTVAHLRAAGHRAFGIDPDRSVLTVALENFEGVWYRRGSAADLTEPWLSAHRLPATYDAVTLLGNVVAFLPSGSAEDLATRVASMLRPGGVLVVGTTTTASGGVTINDLDRATQDASLVLRHRFADWHLTPHHDSPWSVSVYQNPSGALPFASPDGIFVLPD